MKEIQFDKEELKQIILKTIKWDTNDTIEKANPDQIFRALGLAIRGQIMDSWIATREETIARDLKMVYYMSMEFLMGRALGNNLINLKAYRAVREVLEELGINLDEIEDQERDWALGNGGLGRLAACFLDSLATLGYPAYGCGIRYKYGMFRQEIRDGYQKELPDAWLKNGNPFEVRRENHTTEIRFGGYTRGETDADGRNH